MKISERKLKKAEQEINSIINELLKPYRGLIGVNPRIKVMFHGHTDESKMLWPVFEGKLDSSGTVSWKTLSSGKLEITVYNQR